MNAAIAIFAYRRAEHLRAMLGTLSKCEGFESSPVVVFVDGPKGDEDCDDVLATRNVVTALPWKNLTYKFSETNKGLRPSIIAGVSATLETYGKVIVLEDDLHLSPVALQYFNAALDRYAEDSRVWSVSGYMYDVPELKGRPTAFALPYAHPWGWATWDRAWSKFASDPGDHQPNFNSRSFRTRFNLGGLADFAQMLGLAYDGKINSWYIRWYYKIFREGGLSIFPPETYIVNDGIGATGATHGSSLNPHKLFVKRQIPSITLVDLPDRLEIDDMAIDHIRNSWDARMHRLVNFLGAIKRKFKR